MTIDSILIRQSDKKEFRVKYLSHWSSIISEDGETDTVKILGGREYVSAYKGFGYYLQDQT